MLRLWLWGRADAETERKVEEIVEILSRILYSKDPGMVAHTERVRKYSEILARAAGASKRDIVKIGQAAQLHDIGKIYVKENILYKKNELTVTEFEHIKTHVDLDAIIQPLLKANISVAQILHVGRLHHERFDGTGYPFKLKGDDIPLGARIIAVADAWDAMTVDRVYRKKLSNEEALQRLKQGSGTQWDPRIIGTFMSAYQMGEIQLIGKQHQRELAVARKQTLEQFMQILLRAA